MEPFKKITGLVAPLDRSNVDTDQIIPKQFLKRVERTGFGKFAFFDWRYLEGEIPNPDFILNFPRYLGSEILVAGSNFGSGSSREHAAMEPRFVGVKAVVVKSFARIHETNLKKQGILALTFDNKDDYKKIKESDTFDINGLQNFSPRENLQLVINHIDGTKDKISLKHTFNNNQIEWFKAGSALNLIAQKNVS